MRRADWKTTPINLSSMALRRERHILPASAGG